MSVDIISIADAMTNDIVYPNVELITPAIKDATNIPIPTIKLFTPRNLPSKPFGIALKNITEFDVENIENPITMRHEEITAAKKALSPIIIGTKAPQRTMPTILGPYENKTDLLSPIHETSLGVRKKKIIITMV